VSERDETGTIVVIVIPLVCFILVVAIVIDIVYRCRYVAYSPKKAFFITITIVSCQLSLSCIIIIIIIIYLVTRPSSWIMLILTKGNHHRYFVMSSLSCVIIAIAHQFEFFLRYPSFFIFSLIPMIQKITWTGNMKAWWWRSHQQALMCLYDTSL
jgi:hypothetical protein